MPFKQDFERRVNEDMMGEKSEASSSAKAREAELDHDHDNDEEDLNEKRYANFKDAPPPRFSTIFTTPPPLKQPSPPTPIFESYPRSRPRNSGVFVPLPLLIIIAVLFLFESTILFAYTVIGLYNTAPSRFLGLMNIPSDQDTSMCNCPAADHQPAQAPINFAPNFMIPQPGQASQLVTFTEISTTTVTATPSLDISSMLSNILATMTTASASTSTSTSSTSTTTSSSTSTIDLQSQASQMASDIMSMMETMTTSTSTVSTTSSSDGDDSERSTVFKTVNPTPTVSSTKYVYVNEDGSTEAGPQSTVYSTKVVKAKRTTGAENGAKSMVKIKRDVMPQPTSMVEMTLEDALAE